MKTIKGRKEKVKVNKSVLAKSTKEFNVWLKDTRAKIQEAKFKTLTNTGLLKSVASRGIVVSNKETFLRIYGLY